MLLVVGDKRFPVNIPDRFRGADDIRGVRGARK